MSKLKNPCLSLGARGTIGKAISFVKRQGQNIVEKMPIPKDPRSPDQLTWRTMYQKCAALWHDLSESEKAGWNSAGGIRHMTGFAYWQSQCLRPNPGIYLPLLGGTMQGDIDTDSHKVTGLLDPVQIHEAARKKYVDDLIVAYTFNESVRVYAVVPTVTQNDTAIAIPFINERWDTNALHSNTVNSTRLTCKRAGVYHVTGHFRFAANAVGGRYLLIQVNGATNIARDGRSPGPANFCDLQASTLYNLAVNDYVELIAIQTSGGALNVRADPNYGPEFMMAMVGLG